MVLIKFRAIFERKNIISRTFDLYLKDNEGREIFYKRIGINKDMTTEVFIPDNTRYVCYAIQKKEISSGEVSTGVYKFEINFSE